MTNYKKILYVDMDGVMCDFMKEVYEAFPNIDKMDKTNQESVIDFFLEKNPRYFSCLPPIEGAIDTIRLLSEFYQIYFLSTPARNVPFSYMDKKKWLNEHIFSKMDISDKNLILTHRKDLAIGDYLIDDRLVNGSESFKGTFLHFGSEEFPDWKHILEYFKNKDHDLTF